MKNDCNNKKSFCSGGKFKALKRFSETDLTMKCIIPGVNVKVFGRAIHSLSKIGDEVYIDPMQHGLGLRTVNSSRSAYSCFVFAPTFFQHYDDSQEKDDEPVRCKVNMKSCLTVFKSLSHLEKTVERCKITVNTKLARVIFQLYCKHGIVKTYNLAFIECETLQAVFSKDLCPNAITAQSRLLCDVVMNFQAAQEEVTLCVNPQKVSLKNYVEDEPVIHTEMTLTPDEFDSFQVGVDAEVTFCLKELRAILAFSEAGNLPLSMNFESAGKPIVFSIEGDSSYEANFVLATLADTPAGSQASQSQQSRVQSTSKSQRINTMSSVRKRPSESSYNVSNDTVRPSTSKEQKTNGYSKNRDSSKRKESSRQLDEALQSLMNDDFEWDPMAGGGDFTSVANTTEPHPREEEPRQDGAGDSNSPEIPVVNQQQKVVTPATSSKPLLIPADNDEDDDDDDCVPGTPPPPPNKKFKSLFFGFSQASNEPEERLPTQEVLAEDTDEED